MLKKVLVGTVLFVWLFAPMAATAQEIPPGKWWRLPRVAEHLNLSGEEKSQLDELFLQSRRRLIDLKSALERERFELDNLLEQETLDEKGVMDRFRKLEKARSVLADERFRSLLEARKILGFERYQQLKILVREFKKGKRPGGRRGHDEGASLMR
ncbi:MAG: periplasmic heavy metal sensor [Thermodesulfobacteriota bacterium]|nr:periplasmic heavy metal sensor [Thermodesulfobacteriota bacterium]